MPRDHSLPRLSRPPARLSGSPGSDVLSRLKPRDGLVLYYPGAGTDYGPLQHFALNLDLAVAVYVDYLASPSTIREMLRSVSATEPTLQRVTPKDLGCRTWADFWPEQERSLMFARPSRAFGFQCDLQIHPGRSTRLIYLVAEGHQTFGRLLGTALQPDLVVLQDHGFGGNWRDFGGRAPCTAWRARPARCLPCCSRRARTPVSGRTTVPSESPFCWPDRCTTTVAPCTSSAAMAAGLWVTGIRRAYLAGCGMTEGASPRHRELHPLPV